MQEIKEDMLPVEGAGREELKELYGWNFEDAQAAQVEFDNREDNLPYAAGPLFRWLAAQELKDLRNAFEEGKESAILEAFFTCSLRDLPIPKWCSMAYVEAYRKVRLYKAGSWDDVFGKPHPKGTHLNAKLKKREYMLRVYYKIKEIKKADPSAAIDMELFKKVGMEFAIGSRTLVGEYYAEAKKMMEK